MAYPIVMQVIARRRDPDEVFVVDASALYQIAFLALAAAVAAWRLGKNRALRARLISFPLGLLSAYTILALASTLWSERPDYTLFRAAEAGVFLILVVDSAISMGAWGVRVQVVFACVCAVVWHLLDLRFERSVFVLHNSLVPAVSVGVLFLVGPLHGWRWRLASALIAGSVVVSTSTASYIAVLAGLVVLAISPPRPRFALALVAGIVIAILAGIPDAEVTSLLTWNKSERNIQTGSGRIPVWEWLLTEKLPESPIVGFGFGVGESSARLYNTAPGGLRMTHLHNTLMSSLANLGYAGGCLIVCFWAGALGAAWRAARGSASTAPIAAVVACMVNSLSVASVGGPVSFPWIAQVYLVAFLSARWSSPS